MMGQQSAMMGQPGMMGQPAMMGVMQPTMAVIPIAPVLGEFPQVMDCLSCKQRITTNTEKKMSSNAIVVGLVLCLFCKLSIKYSLMIPLCINNYSNRSLVFLSPLYLHEGHDPQVPEL